MAHDDSLCTVGLGERSDLDMALLGVRNGKHAGVLRVESAQAIWIVARV